MSRSRDARCCPISRERNGNVLRRPKLVWRMSTSRAIMRTSLKVKVTRQTNAETGSASYLPNGKAYEVQSWYTEDEDPRHRQSSWPQRSKVMWCVWLSDMSRTKRPRNTKIGRRVAHITGNNVHQFQGHRSRSPGWLMLRLEVCRTFRTERPTNFKLGTQTEYEDPTSAWWPPTSKVKVAMSRGASDRC